MNIHEYQAKQVFRQFGILVPEGRMTQSPEEAYEITEQLGCPVVVKAQIHAGGRGKGGGVKMAATPQEAESSTREMIGSQLVTHQTGPNGKQVQRVLIEQGLQIDKEFYLGIVIDRSRKMPVMMGSQEGGVEIEEVAQNNPESIVRVHVDPSLGMQGFQARSVAFRLGLGGPVLGKAIAFLTSLFQVFRAHDCSLLEVNPLVLTEQGELYALDAKMNLDDSALYRHPEIRLLRDFSEEDPLEIQASRHGLNYIKLDGSVGCMVNGAGLAMATMDIIQLAGGSPANFLDVGGGASVEQVKSAFQILTSDPNVRAVLINIFGGIVRCDVVAEGVVQAAREVGVLVPMVVRLEGTNVERGREILKGSGIDFEVATGMADAARKVVGLAGRTSGREGAARAG